MKYFGLSSLIRQIQEGFRKSEISSYLLGSYQLFFTNDIDIRSILKWQTSVLVDYSTRNENAHKILPNWNWNLHFPFIGVSARLPHNSRWQQIIWLFLSCSCEGVSVYSVSTPLTVFLYPYGGRYARFTTFRVRIFICGPIGRKWMSYYLKNSLFYIIQTFYDHCTHERGRLKKFFETSDRPIGRFLG